MTYSFLIPFSIALITAFLAYQSREEIVKTFSTIVMLISLFVSFVWTPWLVQILILAASLGAMRLFCNRHSCQDVLQQDTSED